MTDVSIRSSDGLRLEGSADEPVEPRAALVLCHPHPQMGGTMNAPLLLALRDDLVTRDWAVLRFNFRGIGRSEGRASTGIEEVADALGAVDEAAARFEGLPLAIAGWSFGGAVAVRVAAKETPLVACVAIAPAVREKPGITAGLPPAGELTVTLPLLVVCGGNDEHVDPREVRTWADGVTHAEYHEVAGANHFFWAKYDRLSNLVADWLDDQIGRLSERGGG